MARERDEGKRLAILAAAKRLFAKTGFDATSVADLSREVALPVGTLYTYFENKDAIVQTLVAEGWASFFETLSSAVTGPGSPEERLSLIVYRFLPELFSDLDLISIILARADKDDELEDKLERLGALVSSLMAELADSRGLSFDFPPKRAMAAIGVYLLGSLDTLRVSRSAGIDLGAEDLIDFIRLSVQSSFGVELKYPSSPSKTD
jgi:AcrR family transcriptional regulator